MSPEIYSNSWKYPTSTDPPTRTRLLTRSFLQAFLAPVVVHYSTILRLINCSLIRCSHFRALTSLTASDVNKIRKKAQPGRDTSAVAMHFVLAQYYQYPSSFVYFHYLTDLFNISTLSKQLRYLASMDDRVALMTENEAGYSCLTCRNPSE